MKTVILWNIITI